MFAKENLDRDQDFWHNVFRIDQSKMLLFGKKEFEILKRRMRRTSLVIIYDQILPLILLTPQNVFVMVKSMHWSEHLHPQLLRRFKYVNHSNKKH